MVIRDTGSRSGRMETSPNPIDFGVSPPHGSADAMFTIPRAQSDAVLNASIVADDSQGRFRILSLKSFEDTTEKETDGTRPLRVSRGQRVEIALRFFSLVPKDQDYYTAVLLIQDGSGKQPWKPIHADMTALVGGITTSLPSVVQIQRGQQLNVPITVVSDAGPDATVSYTSRSRPGLSLMTRQILVPRGSSITDSLALTATPTAPLGTYEVIVESAAFDGKLVTPLRLPVIVRSPLPGFADPCRFQESMSSPASQDNQTRSNWGIIDSLETILGFLPTQKLFQPASPYEIANAVRQAEAAGTTIRALGSGWSFSDAVLPQASPIEGAGAAAFRGQGLSGELNKDELGARSSVFSNSFGLAIDTFKLDKNLQTLLPSILADDILANPKLFGPLFFVEGGIKIDSLNVLLDSQTPRVALKTMGGSAGQTIAGALSTGTHGGDFHLPPLADSVRAFYLIGHGGTHHWIEPPNQITDRLKIQATFPCIQNENIHYDDDMFRAVLVSMGGMGVIYAVILDVVAQYSLLQVNKWSTWADVKRNLDGLFDGSWLELPRILQQLGMEKLLQQLGIENLSPNRFVQVAINPIRRDDGDYNCYVSNRVEIPFLGLKGGVAPLVDYTQISKAEVSKAIQNDPNFGLHEGCNFSGYQFEQLFRAVLQGSEPDPIEDIQNLLAFCKNLNYPWAIRAVIDETMKQAFPLPTSRGREVVIPPGAAIPGLPRAQPETSPGVPDAPLPDPQIDVAYKVMAPGGTTRPFRILNVTSVEPVFSFYSRSDHPGADVITFIEAVFGALRQAVDRDRVFPVGYLTLRVTGKTEALMGMQRFDRNGHVELSLMGNPDDYEVVRRVERIALENGGALHWGQSNGLMTFRDLGVAYGTSNISKWLAAQRLLGGDTFTNSFMRRCGLVPTPVLKLDRTSISFEITSVGDIKTWTLQITNIGSAALTVSPSASSSGPFQWTGFDETTIPPGGFQIVDIEFMPRSPGRQTGTLLLESNAPESPHRVALSGAGYQSPTDGSPRSPL